MRMRALGRDVSVFGHMDSLLGFAITTGTGKPHEAVRSLGSGAVSNAWDFITGSDGIGERIRDNPWQIGKRVMENFVPIAAEEAGEIGKEFIEGVREGDPAHAAGAAAFGLIGEFHGLKSTPLSISEQLQDLRLETARRMFDEGLFDYDLNGNPRNEQSGRTPDTSELDDIERDLNAGNVFVPTLRRRASPWELLPQSVKDQVNKDARVNEKMVERDDQARTRQRPSQLYFDDVAQVKEEFKESVAKKAEVSGYHPDAVDEDGNPTRGAGKKFRLDLAELHIVRADDMAEVQVAHADFVEELDKRKEDKEQALEATAMEDYIRFLIDSDLEDSETGEYNFRERERREAAMRDPDISYTIPGTDEPIPYYGDVLIDRIEEGMREDEHPLQRQLREDREYLKPYWNVRETLLGMLHTKLTPEELLKYFPVWEEYIDAIPKRQTLIEVDNRDFIKAMKGWVADTRGLMKDGDAARGIVGDPQIGVLQLRWDFKTTPATTEEVQELLRQVDE